MLDDQIIDLYFKRDESAITETSLKYGAYCNKIRARGTVIKSSQTQVLSLRQIDFYTIIHNT